MTQPNSSSHSDGHTATKTWAAWYNTWLLIKLMPKDVVFSFLSSHKEVQTCAVSWRLHCSCSSSDAGLSLNIGMASTASAGMSGRLAGRVCTAAISSHRGSFPGRRPLSGPTIPLHRRLSVWQLHTAGLTYGVVALTLLLMLVEFH